MQSRPYPRYAFRCEARFCPHGTATSMAGVLSDISLSGCYLETLMPLPIGTRVDVSFSTDGRGLCLSGVIRVVHLNMGMGIQFADLSAENAAALQQLVEAQNHAN